MACRSFFVFCQAQPQLNSTQSQLNLRLRWSLFLFDPATHHIDSATDQTAGKVSFETGKESNKRPSLDNLKLTLLARPTASMEAYKYLPS